MKYLFPREYQFIGRQGYGETTDDQDLLETASADAKERVVEQIFWKYVSFVNFYVVALQHFFSL